MASYDIIVSNCLYIRSMYSHIHYIKYALCLIVHYKLLHYIYIWLWRFNFAQNTYSYSALHFTHWRMAILWLGVYDCVIVWLCVCVWVWVFFNEIRQSCRVIVTCVPETKKKNKDSRRKNRASRMLYERHQTKQNKTFSFYLYFCVNWYFVRDAPDFLCLSSQPQPVGLCATVIRCNRYTFKYSHKEFILLVSEKKIHLQINIQK